MPLGSFIQLVFGEEWNCGRWASAGTVVDRGGWCIQATCMVSAIVKSMILFIMDKLSYLNSGVGLIMFGSCPNRCKLMYFQMFQQYFAITATALDKCIHLIILGMVEREYKIQLTIIDKYFQYVFVYNGFNGERLRRCIRVMGFRIHFALAG